jgi:hypothetical protein
MQVLSCASVRGDPASTSQCCDQARAPGACARENGLLAVTREGDDLRVDEGVIVHDDAASVQALRFRRKGDLKDAGSGRIHRAAVRASCSSRGREVATDGDA